ncbi:TerB family tellurite resistance protein [Chitinimonas sp. BJYL2]|uniref:tellurite resistance TerB family protein n=1 Tax=Chitinimonas sp. BJYL2 TaxID=2976696 RepID=UPI0022B3F041|nr:TerB family tellurite resistance protein [Chitinimonas sp. BJYL2]
MRHYPDNSPAAAARLIALTLLADGGMDPSELAALERSQVLAQLGISYPQFQQVLLELCADALQYSDWPGMQQLAGDPAVLDRLLGEISDPGKQVTVLRAMLDVADADQQLTDSERTVLGRAMQCWHPALQRSGTRLAQAA